MRQILASALAAACSHCAQSDSNRQSRVTHYRSWKVGVLPWVKILYSPRHSSIDWFQSTRSPTILVCRRTNLHLSWVINNWVIKYKITISNDIDSHTPYTQSPCWMSWTSYRYSQKLMRCSGPLCQLCIKVSAISSVFLLLTMLCRKIAKVSLLGGSDPGR